MANELTTIEPLRLPDLARPDRMPRLPGWVASRIASVNEVMQSDGNGNWRKVATLPETMMLGSSERQQIEAYAGTLDRTLDRTPDRSAEAEAETLVLIGKLMLSLPGQRSTETGAEATGEAYQAALDDLPPWAVAAAMRHWYRGDAMQIGKIPHDYRWRPAPATLRALAFAEAAAVKGRAISLRNLIAAVPLIEYSDEHRGMMLGKLSEVMHAITDKPPPQSAETTAAE